MNCQFITGENLLHLCEKHDLTIAEVMVRRECELSHRTADEVRAQMAERLAVMHSALEKGLTQAPRSVGGLVEGQGKRLNNLPSPLMGGQAAYAAAAAMAIAEVNAAMGRIIAAPTAGSCGVLPGALFSAARSFGFDDAALVEALFVSAAVGLLIQTNATVSGAEGGCQAEVGAASAMAAAALTFLQGGSAGASLSAAALALQNLMGLVCDPVAGLVEVPCVNRNSIGAVNALLSADIVLSGTGVMIPFDETVDAMYAVGCSLSPALRESAQGGIAATPTAKAAEKGIFAAEQYIPEGLGR